MSAWYERLAHDLKGPLAPLQTAAFLLRNDSLPAERRHELAALVERQTRRLDRMIDELGEWTRASRGRLVTRRAPCELALVLDLALVGVPGCASVPAFAPGLERAVLAGDEARLAQLFATLLAHAQARDPHAPPALRVEPDPAGIAVTVADRGPAPPPETLAALLTEPDPHPYDEGLGLRLPIAAAIAQAHGGALQAEAGEGGEGLRLRCVLPRVP